jgi:hypothetical protein
MKNLFAIALMASASVWLVACSDRKAPTPSPAPVDAAAAAAAAEPEPRGPQLWCAPNKCNCLEGKEIKEEPGTFQRCRLAEDTVVQGIKIAGGTRYSETQFNQEGVLIAFSLPEPVKIGGIECCCAGVELYDRDKVKSCYVKTTQTVDGVACKGSIKLKKDGKLHRCQTAEAVKFDNFEAPAETWITRYDEGNAVDRFENGTNVLTVDGYPCKGFFNYLHPNGKIRKCELAEDRKIEGKAYTAGTSVCFSDAGKVIECSLMSFVSM